MKPNRKAAEMATAELAAYIDHSVLKPEFTLADVRRETVNAVRYGCKTVCVNPASIQTARQITDGTPTGVCVVIDFPFGCSRTSSRVAQTRDALAAGVDEVDIVANIGWIRSGEIQRVEADLRAVIEECHRVDVPVKVILETDALSIDQIRAAGEVAISANADYIKTSTGFYTGTPQHKATGASDAMVALMMDIAAGRCQVKGSGSIRDREHFLRLIDAGIDRMGIGYGSTPVVLGIQTATTDPTVAGY